MRKRCSAYSPIVVSKKADCEPPASFALCNAVPARRNILAVLSFLFSGKRATPRLAETDISSTPNLKGRRKSSKMLLTLEITCWLASSRRVPSSDIIIANSSADTLARVSSGRNNSEIRSPKVIKHASPRA